jgi:hypothetical protein
MMRTLLFLIALLAGCASTPPNVGDMAGDQVVIARLDDARGFDFGCGVLAFYGPATYTVVDGPRSLEGKKIDVLVWCLGGSMRESPDFRIGQLYRLHLTKDIPHRSDFDQPLEASPYAFYLRGDPELVEQ